MPTLQRTSSGASMSQPQSSPQRPRDDRLHEEQRAEPEHHARRGEGGDERRVEPDRGATDHADVQEVRDDVRRVREEEEPREPERELPCSRRAPPVGVVQREGEEEREPRKEQVPDEEAIPVRARLGGADEQHGSTQAGGQDEREERRYPSIAEADHPSIVAAGRGEPGRRGGREREACTNRRSVSRIDGLCPQRNWSSTAPASTT